MAISNFKSVPVSDWNNGMSAKYNAIGPSINKTGANDPNLSVSLYVRQDNNTGFVIALASTGQETLSLVADANNSNQLDLTCTSSPGNQSTIYFEFTEDQGWTDNFNVAMDLTTTSKTKGTWTFTKGKSIDV